MRQRLNFCSGPGLVITTACGGSNPLGACAAEKLGRDSRDDRDIKDTKKKDTGTRYFYRSWRPCYLCCPCSRPRGGAHRPVPAGRTLRTFLSEPWGTGPQADAIAGTPCHPHRRRGRP